MPNRWAICLPYPPSGHKLWAQNPRTRRKFRTTEYEVWRADADHACLTQFGKLPSLKGMFALVATVIPGKGFRRNGDGDNRLKAPVDWMVDRGILQGDSWDHIVDWRIKLDRQNNAPKTLIHLALERVD